jgi:predicted membrane-bound mannosyltransferase
VLLIYTVAIVVIYSAIPYKTPWLALNLWLPLTLLAGFGGAFLWRVCKPAALRGLLVIAAAAAVVALGFDTWQRVFQKPADERNPYAYAHTSEGLLELPRRVAALIEQNPMRNNARITVIAADPWPLPWYLRKFSQVGYWQPGQKDPAPGEILITSTAAGEQMGARLKNWRPEFFEQRPGVLLVLWTPPEKETAP